MIPKAKRSDYLFFDRGSLPYLNWIKKLNCQYCAYANGLVAFVQEVAGRSEQYWCPIRHARKMTTLHSRYTHFVEYGDGAGYRRMMEPVRKDFGDLKDDEKGGGS